MFLSGLMLMAAGSYLFSAVDTWTPVVWVMTLVVLLRVGSECLFRPSTMPACSCSQLPRGVWAQAC